MLQRVLAALVVLLCALPVAGSAQSYSVAVIGDMPYVLNETERQTYLPRYQKLLFTLDSADVAAVVHVGDYTRGPFCGDSVVNERFGEFSRSAHPFIFVFGDNDWTDCARGGFDPLERLAKLREVFTQGDVALGKAALPLTRQSRQPPYAKFRENVRWTLGNELYVALNLPSGNNWGEDDAPGAEYVERNGANLAWLRESFDVARRENRRGIAIFIQANPGLDRVPWSRSAKAMRPYKNFNAELQKLAAKFGGPVLLVHGDTHYFRVDKPFVDRAGAVIANITRVEGFAHPNYHWVRLRVDAADPNVFAVVPEIVH